MKYVKIVAAWLIGFLVSYGFLLGIDAWWLPGVLFLTPYVATVYLALALWTLVEDLLNILFKVNDNKE